MNKPNIQNILIRNPPFVQKYNGNLFVSFSSRSIMSLKSHTKYNEKVQQNNKDL